MLTIQQIVASQTAAQWRTQMVSGLVGLGVRADLWVPGGVASTMLTVVSVMLSLVSNLIATLVSQFYLPLASGQGLVNLALYVYGVRAPTATAATGFITLTNSGGGVYSGGPGSLTFLNPSTGQTYTNTASYSLGAVGGPTAVITIPIACTALGTVGNANSNAITVMQTALTGVAATNANPLVGLDALTDVALRALCLTVLGAAGVRGVQSAYQYAISVAVNSVSGAPVNINRNLVSPASHTGVVTVALASPAGAPDPNDVTGVIASIEANARPQGVTVFVYGAVNTNYTATVNVYCTAPAGISQTTILNAINAALTTLFENYPITGETINGLGTNKLFGYAVAGAIGEGVANAGASLVSISGLIDLSLTPAGTNFPVAVENMGVNVIILAPPVGTFLA